MDSREAVGQDPAAEIGAEIALDVGGKSPAGGAAVAGGCEEGLQPLADDGVQQSLLWLAAAVSGEGCAGGTVAALPGLDRLVWRRHGAASSQAVGRSRLGERKLRAA